MPTNRIRLVFVTTGVRTGGAETMLVKMVNALDRSRFTVIVVALGHRTNLAELLEEAGAKVIVLGMTGFWRALGGAIRFMATVRRLEPDLLQGWMIHGNLAAQIAGSILNVPVIWGVRHSVLMREEKPLTRLLDLGLRYLSALPSRIVYNSQAGRAYHEALGYDSRRSVVIPNGFDASAFYEDNDARQALRRHWGIADDCIVIGMAARYHPMKDHNTFLKAASLLRRNVAASTRYILVGQGCDEKNLDLMTCIASLNLEGAVMLLGERSDIHSVINVFDIGVLSSSDGEGFPNVIGELMCCGVPCVVTNVGDSAWIVGDTGLTVQRRDAEAMADALGKLVCLGTSQRALLGDKAKSRVNEMFSIRHIANRFQELYLGSV